MLGPGDEKENMERSSKEKCESESESERWVREAFSIKSEVKLTD